MEKKGLFKKFIGYYKPYKFLFFTDLLCAVLVASIDLVFPQILRYLMRNTSALNISLLWRTGLSIAGVLLLLYIIRYFSQYFITSWGHIMGARMERDMRNDLFSHLQRLSFSYYDDHNTGDMLSRIVSDLFDISELAHHGPENLFLALIKIIGSLTLLFLINVKLTLVLAVVTLGILIFSFEKNKRLRAIFANNRKKISGINSQVQDSLSGIRVVQSFTNEQIEEKKFGVANEKFLDSKTQSYNEMGKYHAGNGFLRGLLYITIIAVGCLLVSQKMLEVADLFIYILYINIFVEPINVLINFTEMFQKGAAGFRRFYEILETDPEIKELENAKNFSGIKKAIVYENVNFNYSESSTVLKNISVAFEAGKTTALVGPSGGGKTTICSLLPRFYDVTSGSITIDGIDIRDMNLRSLRQNIGIVQQDVYLFGSNIGENIRYGNPMASDDEVIEAAKKAHIHDFIMSLPNGYATNIGERGVKLSGGQKQRISIARVFLKNPPILILDEATSALDSENEVLIQKALDELSENRTVIVIAHRLSTIRAANTILVITDEGIIEKGTDEELLKLNGVYAQLKRMTL
ncbi:MAG: thiamine ABC transporter permease [Treponema sp.]|nr:MAG: thiamine ABC transporter permease [Treponema sp.]